MSIPLNVDYAHLFDMLNSMDTETFGQRLKRLRLMRGLSQRKLATAAGLTNGAISQAESGDLWVGQLPSLDIVRRLARALDVSIDVLADDEAIRPHLALSDSAMMLRFGADAVPEEEAQSALEDFAATALHGRDYLIPQNYDDMRRPPAKRKPKPEPTTFKLRISGNCLSGDVEDGEVVWFDTALPREPVCLVFAVKDDHEAHIKRLVERDGIPWLESNDGWGEPVDEHWRLVARAFNAQRRLL